MAAHEDSRGRGRGGFVAARGEFLLAIDTFEGEPAARVRGAVELAQGKPDVAHPELRRANAEQNTSL
jgi:hypothetical protein